MAMAEGMEISESNVTGKASTSFAGSVLSTPKAPKKVIVKPKLELSKVQMLNLKEAFDLFDTDCKGLISFQHLKVAIRAVGFEPLKAEIKRFMESVGEHEAGCLSFDDFLTIMATKMFEKDSKADIMKSFHLFDLDEIGTTQFENLKEIANILGEKLTDEELPEMMSEADLNGDGEIDADEFVKIMKRIRNLQQKNSNSKKGPAMKICYQVDNKLQHSEKYTKQM